MSQNITFSIAIFAVFVLVWGGIWMIRKGNERQKGVLMIIAALVLLGNVMIWSWP